MSDVLDYEAIERKYDEYDNENEFLIEDEFDESQEEVEPEDLDDETTERLYDEHDHEREMFIGTESDEPLEPEESDNLDDEAIEAIERVYDEIDHEKLMKDKYDGLLEEAIARQYEYDTKCVATLRYG